MLNDAHTVKYKAHMPKCSYAALTAICLWYWKLYLSLPTKV